jgi:hypothetical protein
MGYRKPWGLGELPVKASGSKQPSSHLSPRNLLARPTEFEELGFCNSF